MCSRRALARLCSKFTAHPHSVNETYCQHLKYACCTGLKLVRSGLACIVHGLFPFAFETYASDRIPALGDQLRDRRRALERG